MRRLAAIALSLLAGFAGIAVAGLTGGAEAASDYKVDAVFDTSKGIIPGQLVKIAGARVGVVEDVELTRDYKARIKMAVDSRFAPFKADANCLIRPEGLIGENFVECDPGTPDAEPLEASDGQPPTVPVESTAVPVNLTDLFDIFNAPVRDRFAVIIAALGSGIAGRGEDLNQLLRRANPALEQARRTIAILNEQRDRLADTVVASDRLLAELSGRSDRVADFIDGSAAVMRRTAARDDELREAIRLLPPLLDEVEPALANFDRAMTDATPLLGDLRTAAPDVERLTIDLEPFARAALPALRELDRQVPRARRLARVAGPVIAQLRDFAARARPVSPRVAALFESMRDTGVVEGLLDFIYFSTAATARYDGTSHILPARIGGNDCSQHAEVEDPACSAKYGAEERHAAAAAERRRPARRSGRRAASAPEAAAGSPAVPEAPRGLIEELREQLEALTGGVGGRVNEELDSLTGDRPPPPRAVAPLLDYLLR